MSEHTKTPWGIWDAYNIMSQARRLVANCGGYTSNVRGEDSHNENVANARFIVTACNNHEELAEILRDLSREDCFCPETAGTNDLTFVATPLCLSCKARNLLAKIEKEQNHEPTTPATGG